MHQVIRFRPHHPNALGYNQLHPERNGVGSRILKLRADGRHSFRAADGRLREKMTHPETRVRWRQLMVRHLRNNDDFADLDGFSRLLLLVQMAKVRIDNQKTIRAARDQTGVGVRASDCRMRQRQEIADRI